MVNPTETQLDQQAVYTEKMANELKVAAQQVKEITKDVELGIVPKSDLVNAINELERKMQMAEIQTKQAKQLSGLDLQNLSLVVGLGLLGVGVFSLLK